MIRDHAPNALDLINRRHCFRTHIDDIEKKTKSPTKSKVRARVLQVFGVIKGMFGFV